MSAPIGSRRSQDAAPPGGPAKPEEMLEAVADLIAAGRAPLEALIAVQALRGSTARWAAQISLAMRKRAGFAAAVAQVMALSAAESSFVGSAEASEQLPAALRVIASRRRATRALRRDVLGASLSPLVILALTVLALPLPSVFLGGSYLRPLAGHFAAFASAAFVIFVVVPRLARHPSLGPRLIGLGERVPVIGTLLRFHREATLAGALSEMAGQDGVTVDSVRIASLLVQSGAIGEHLATLPAPGPTEVAPGPLLDGVVSESFALVLLAGGVAGRSAERLGSFRDNAWAVLASRVRMVVLAVLWGLVLVVSVEGVGTLISHPIPGLGGDLKMDGPGMEELDKLLDGTK